MAKRIRSWQDSFFSFLLLCFFQCHGHVDSTVARHACDLGSSETLALLQRKALPSGLPSEWETQEQIQRLEEVKPIVWLHVPKCGSTFANSLLQHRGVCPFTRPELSLPFNEECGHCLLNLHKRFDLDFECPGAFRSAWELGKHKGIGTNYDTLKGHLMTMVREPRSRMVSAYNFGRHSWPWDNDKQNVTLSQYANVMQGHMLKMLVRDYDRNWPSEARAKFFAEPSQAEVEEAHRRFEEGFAFVGLVEQWQLSMCLFHKKFGGRCTEAEFWKSNDKADTDLFLVARQEHQLLDFEDPYDESLYALATQRFEQALRRFNVTAESCSQCWHDAKLIAV